MRKLLLFLLLSVSVACTDVPTTPDAPAAPAAQVEDEGGTVTAHEGVVGWPYCNIVATTPWNGFPHTVELKGQHSWRKDNVDVRFRLSYNSTWTLIEPTDEYLLYPYVKVTPWCHTSQNTLAHILVQWKSTSQILCEYEILVGPPQTSCP